MISPKEILLAAAEKLEKGNWLQGKLFKNLPDGDVCMCAHGAIRFCAKLEDYPIPNNDVIRAALSITSLSSNVNSMDHWDRHYQKQYPEYRNLCLAHYYAHLVGLTFQFNDEPGRTKEEVIEKLKEAAELAEQNEKGKP